MYTKIYQNSYIILIITFILLSVLFYLFEIGFTTEIKNGKVVKKFSWKYPLAISLIVWVVWHFFLYPPPEEIKPDVSVEYANTGDIKNVPANQFVAKSDKLMAQKIFMRDWN